MQCVFVLFDELHPRSLTEKVFSLCMQSVSLLLFFSPALYVNGIYIVILIMLFVPVEQLQFYHSRRCNILMELSRCDDESTS